MGLQGESNLSKSKSFSIEGKEPINGALTWEELIEGVFITLEAECGEVNMEHFSADVVTGEEGSYYYDWEASGVIL